MNVGLVHAVGRASPEMDQRRTGQSGEARPTGGSMGVGGASSTSADRRFEALLRATGVQSDAIAVQASPALAALRMFEQERVVDHRDERLSIMRRDDADQRLRGASRIGGPSAPGVSAPGSRTARLEFERAESADQQIKQANDKAAKQGSDSNGGGQDLRSRRLTDLSSSSRDAADGGERFGRDSMTRQAPDTPEARSTRSDRHNTATHARRNQSTPTDTSVEQRSASVVAAPKALETNFSRPSETVSRDVSKVSSIQRGGGADGPAGARSNTEEAVQARVKDDSSRSAKPGTPSSVSAGRPRATGSGQVAAYERIARAVQVRIGRSESVVRIRLDPPSLGQVRVEVRMKQDQVYLRLTTETAEARSVLMSQIGNLRASLEEQGLRVQRIEFNLPTTEQSGVETGAGETTDAFGANSNLASQHTGSGADNGDAASRAGPRDRQSSFEDDGDALDAAELPNDPIEMIGEGRLDIRA